MSFLLTGPKRNLELHVKHVKYAIFAQKTLGQVSSKTSLFDGPTRKPPPTSPGETAFAMFTMRYKFLNDALAFWVDRIVTSDSEENKS